MEYYNIMLKDVIKRNRQRLNLSQKELAEMLGYQQNVISKYEKGRKPDYETLRKLCVIFDISGDEILELETEKQKSNIIITNKKSSWHLFQLLFY